MNDPFGQHLALSPEYDRDPKGKTRHQFVVGPHVHHLHDHPEPMGHPSHQGLGFVAEMAPRVSDECQKKISQGDK